VARPPRADVKIARLPPPQTKTCETADTRAKKGNTTKTNVRANAENNTKTNVRANAENNTKTNVGIQERLRETPQKQMWETRRQQEQK